MKVMRPDVERITALANIEIDAAHLTSLEKDFGDIIDFIGALQRVDTSETIATSHATDLENIFRADDVVPFLHHRTILEMSAHREGSLIRVPAIFDGSEDNGDE
ncbi:MAG: Asp-tRNA(Asn)/Glu-tRNA(Gln) amidotransferase subunit GatC [Candidatus Kerfeldbacteria bacterium]